MYYFIHFDLGKSIYVWWRFVRYVNIPLRTLQCDVCKRHIISNNSGVFGQLGHGPIKKQTRPKLVEEIAHENVQLICCGSFETVSFSASVKQVCHLWEMNVSCMTQCHQHYACNLFNLDGRHFKPEVLQMGTKCATYTTSRKWKC